MHTLQLYNVLKYVVWSLPLVIYCVSCSILLILFYLMDIRECFSIEYRYWNTQYQIYSVSIALSVYWGKCLFDFISRPIFRICYNRIFFLHDFPYLIWLWLCVITARVRFLPIFLRSFIIISGFLCIVSHP